MYRGYMKDHNYSMRSTANHPELLFKNRLNGQGTWGGKAFVGRKFS